MFPFFDPSQFNNLFNEIQRQNTAWRHFWTGQFAAGFNVVRHIQKQTRV